jgi:hypothetical protein
LIASTRPRIRSASATMAFRSAELSQNDTIAA